MGVNKFVSEQSPYENIQKIDLESVSNQIENLKKFKKNRDVKLIESILVNLENKANTEENIIPIIIEAVKAHATLGEISDTLRTAFGEYKG